MIPSLSPGWRMAGVYGASFVTFGIHLPFFPVLLAHRGLGEVEIAVVLAVPTILRVFTAPILGLVTDRVADRRLVVTAYAVAAAVGFSLFGFSQGFLAMVAAMAATALFWNGITPGIDTMALALARAGRADYGRMRMWGSVTFILANVLAGAIIARTGAATIYWLLLAAFWLQAASIMVAPRAGPPAAGSVPTAPRPVRLPWADFGLLVRDRRLIQVLAGSALIQASHTMAYGFASLYWASLGFDEGTIGVFWAVGVVAEVILFARGTAITARLGPLGLILLGGAGAALRWALFPVIDGSAGWIAVNLLHAFSFASLHLGTIQFASRTAPEHLAGATQGLVLTISGATMACGTLVSGPIYKALGVDGFLVMSGIAILGMLVVADRVRRPVQPQRAGEGGSRVDPS